MGEMKSEGMPLKTWLPLIGLTFAAFMFNTSEFVPIGLLTDIAGTFSLTEAQAGIMITVYAWTVTILSLPLMVVASRIEFKRLLLLVIALFCAGQVGSAIASTFALLVVSRLLVACAHAVFWSIASPIATMIAGPKHSSLALSLVVTGSSVAMIAGLPLGRAIGLVVGWRLTFACVGVIAFIVLLYMAAVMSRLSAGEPFTLKRLPEILHTPMLVFLYVIVVLFYVGYYTAYSYIEPYLLQISHVPNAMVTLVLTVFGIAGLVGSAMFNRFYDSNRRRFFGIGVVGLVASLALLCMTAAGGLPAAIAVCVLWGLFGTMFNIAGQSEVITNSSAGTSAVAMSIFSGLCNLGVGGGSAIGGVVMNAIGLNYVGFVGAAIVFAAFIVFLFTLFKWMNKAACPN